MIRVNFWENGALRAPVAQFPKDPLNNAPLILKKIRRASRAGIAIRTKVSKIRF